MTTASILEAEAPAETPPRPAATPRLMRAAVIRAPGVAEVAHVPVPEPDRNHLRVRLEGCGACASNIPPWEGREWFRYPMAPGQLGHEAWGRVDAVGADVLHFKVGDRVAILTERA